MKSPEEIQTDIDTKRADLNKLLADHQAAVAAFSQQTALTQQKADRLEGAILALEALLA